MADHARGGESMENAVAAYVLGASEPEETALVRDHLQSCAACRELEARLRRATSTLPLSVEEERPPARLRRRIIDAASAGSPAAGPPARRRMPRLPRAASPRRWLSPPAIAAAVLALAVIGLGGWNVSLQRELEQAQAAVSDHQLAAKSPALASSQGRVVALRSQGVAVVDFKNMPQPEPGRVYEIWLGTSSGKMVPAGVFRPDPDGSKAVVLDQDLSSYSVIALTVEQGPNGTQAPTQAPGMTGSI